MPELSPIQKEIVESKNKIILVIAGPGSGKTRVLTHKVAHLISQGVPEDEILILTFTNKAAKNMVERIEKKINKKTKILGGTFHHTANMFLRKYYNIPNYTIIDEADSIKLLKMIVKEGYNDNKNLPKPETLQKIYSYSRNSLSTFRDYIEVNMPGYLLDEMKSIDEIYKKYSLRKRNMMDFDDLLEKFYELLISNPEIVNKIKEQYKYIFIDEFQDTNKLQFEIIKKIFDPQNSLFIVGDDCQSIYSFRAAEIQNILNFPRVYPTTKTYYLTENYRSSEEIVSFVNDIIKNNKFKFEKELISKREGEKNKPQILYYENQREEAKEIINEIVDLINNKKVSPKEIAILYRSNYLSAYLEIELAKNNIKYLKLGGKKFFESAHVKDVISFLKISSNLIDELGFLRLLTLFEGVGDITAQRIWNEISHEDIIKEILKLQNRKLNKLIEILNEIKQTDSPKSKVKKFIDMYYNDYIFNKYNESYEDRYSDINQLLEIIQIYNTVDEFLEDVILDANIFIEDNIDDKITISTVHQSKGLEWERVYIIGMVQGKFPSKHAINNLDSNNKIEEERRLFYVACSRAKLYLQLSVPETYSFDREIQTSQFIIELSEEFYNINYISKNEQNDFMSADNFL